ncbi:MAG: GCN5-related N-acetyltransferase [Parcubacteria group bacterium GW2011_GWF2_38_76]|nr:MAG: GCN5-related N-acetyltransferase [Parcubacteria group bacterium GW2011_GWF2_38_76]
MKQYFITSAQECDRLEILGILKKYKGDQKDIDIESFRIVKIDKRIVGCIRIKKLKDCFELASLVVLPEYSGQGIGSKLIQEMLKTNDSDIYLLCSSENKDFYCKNMFYPIDPSALPVSLKEEYHRITKLDFTKGIKVVTMVRHANL